MKMWLGKASERGVVVINNWWQLLPLTEARWHFYVFCLFSFLKKNYKKYTYSCSSGTNEIKFEQQLQMTYTDDENDQGVK